jgi:hypothetical protein
VQFWLSALQSKGILCIDLKVLNSKYIPYR